MRRFATFLVIAVGFAFALATLLAQGPPPPPPPPPPIFGPETTTPPSGTGALNGTVVDAVTGKPVAGALVSLISAGGPAVRPPRQLTDAQGRFLFAPLPAGQNYQLTAGKLGYFDGGYGRDVPRGSLRRIVLADGQYFPDATIKIFPTSTISGSVVDEVGEPLVGVSVALQARLLMGGESHWVSGPVTKTDDRGIYRIPSLPSGTYAVMVPSVQHAVPADATLEELTGWTRENIAAAEAAGREIPLRHSAFIASSGTQRVVADVGYVGPLAPRADGRPQVFPTTFHPSARSIASAATIDLGVGEDRRGVDVHLRPALAATVSGRVAGPSEAIAGLFLRLMPAGSENGWVGHEAATATVTDDGRFTFVNVPDGQYTILANRFIAGYVYNPTGTLLSDRLFRMPARLSGESASAVYSAPAGTMFWMLSGRESSAYSGRASVDVAGRDVADVLVTLRAGVSISGRVVVEQPAQANPSMVSAMRSFLQVRAEPAGGEALLGQPGGRVDPQDESMPFRIEGLLPGEYLLRLFPGVGVIKSVRWNERDIGDGAITVGDQPISNLVITTTTATARVQGTVRDRQGRPVDRAAVIYFPTNPAGWRRYGVQPARIRSIQVGTDGSYRFAVPAGEYFLIAVDDALAEAWKDPAFLQRAAAGATRVSIDWGQTNTQDLTMAVIK
jgi:hypothetical protein